MKYVELDQRSDVWFKWREKGITATEAVAISGHSEFATPWRVWAEKTGRVLPPDLSGNPYVQYGIEHEDEVRNLFMVKHEDVVMPACGEWDQNPVFRASFDGLNSQGEPVEIKCPGESTLEDVLARGLSSDAYQMYQWQGAWPGVGAAVAGGLRMTDPDGGRLDTMRQELETITAENEGLTAQVEALRTETAEQKALPEAIQKQKDEGFRLLGELERQIRAGESDKRIAYLTFDDGPYDNTTDAILDILKEKGVHATFFLRHRPDHVAQIQREIREGHTLANHSYSHKIKAVYQSADSCIKEIRDQQKWLTETVGVTPEIYRFPGGSPTAGNKKQAIAAALAADGLGYVDWNCYTGDGLPGVLTTEKAYQNAVSSVGEQKIVVMLMHDYSAATLEALPDIIDTLKAKGYMMMPLFRESVMIRSA